MRAFCKFFGGDREGKFNIQKTFFPKKNQNKRRKNVKEISCTIEVKIRNVRRKFFLGLF